MVTKVRPAAVDADQLRANVQSKYTEVAEAPETGFHFHTGRPLAAMLGYSERDLSGLPDSAIDSFAGTGNPFKFGRLSPGEQVLDVGSGAGFDSFQAARQVGPEGRVVGVDMTQAMIDVARAGAAEMGLQNVQFKLGFAEDLPIEDGSMDVVISNGVINLCPDKVAVMSEVRRVVKPGGRFQIADILVHKEVGQSAKDDIELWSG